MFRRLAPALLAIPLVIGCAGPAKLAERSEEKLAAGDAWRAWQLATRSLDKQPGNPRARVAARNAAAAIAQDWEQRIHALAGADSVAAAEQVLEFAGFRADAARYAVVAVSVDWPRDEQILRHTGARLSYQRGAVAMGSSRPKKAYDAFHDAERFVPGYRDAARLADHAFDKALTRVAVVPFFASSGNAALGREVADEWRDDLARQMAAPQARFTRIVGGDAIEQAMTVAQLGRTSREDALRLGRKAGADRVVWGSIGGVNSETRLHLFSDRIARRLVEKDADGHETTRWTEIPIEVVARVRTVTADVEYEVIATKSGATVARQHSQRSTSARVVWTSYTPEGDLGAYALVSELVRAANPDRARDVESRWKSTCGDQTTLQQVLEARRSTRGPGRYQRDALPRFIAGAAFVFLEDLPPVEDLAFAALAGGWQPLRDDLVRLDPIDEVDLGVAMADDDGR
jgi:hypothetical protein